MNRLIVLLMVSLIAFPSAFGADEKPTPARESLQPFQLLIGKWNAAGIPEGTPDERQKGHWSETLDWNWQFKGQDAWIAVAFEKGKFFKKGELRPLPTKNTFQLKVTTTDDKTLHFEGVYKDKYLSVERVDDKTKETQKLLFALLHGNRITYSYEVKPAEKTFYTRVYRVGATKDGEPFASIGASEKECVVSGGVGTSTVTYKGKTFYVCCTGCRDAFYDTPEKYIAEFEAKRAAKNK